MSFHNNFLGENKVIDNGVLDSQKIKKLFALQCLK